MLNEIKRLAQDIMNLSYQTGASLENAARSIENEMDGSQPSDLVSNALSLAKTTEEQ